VLVNLGYVGNRGTGLSVAQGIDPTPAQYMTA